MKTVITFDSLQPTLVLLLYDKELMGFNQIRVRQNCDMNSEEVEAFIVKLNLGMLRKLKG